MSIPIVCVIGSSGSGKTLLIERLVPELAARGIHAAYVKHTHHDVPLEAPGIGVEVDERVIAAHPVVEGSSYR